MMPKPSGNITVSVEETPAPLQLVLLGIQYAFMVCVYLVIVVIVVRAAKATPETARNAVSLAMVAAAAGTVLQALRHGPVGSGYLAPPVFSAIYLGPSILAAKAEGLPVVACMTVCAGLTEMLVGALLLRMRIVLQPVITGLTISIIALELGIVGSPLFVPTLTVQAAIPNEETAAASGLEKVAIDIFPDRSATSSHGAESILRLGFDI